MAHRDPNEPVYMISIAARLTGLHPQTVRLYERLGLVQPRRAANRNRLYSDTDVERLLQIRRFTQEMGVNLAGVEVILDLLEKMERMQAEMEVLRSSGGGGGTFREHL
ncbi:MAG TPA: MerR family transcriptional regulator [Chthonomonadales bacterium]|nr:MerR family transcriptional regulator [Chthonomonadales bacterium]